jgi:hypothetical protein
VLQSFARTVILKKARQLVGRAGFVSSDVHDLEQELTLRVLQRLSAHDARIAHLHVWLVMLVERAAATILRERRAKKRDPVKIHSLSASGSDGEPIDVADRHAVFGRRAELAFDMAEALDALSAEDRALAEILKSMTPAQAADHLQVPRRELNRQMGAIRRCFENPGLRDYL